MSDNNKSISSSIETTRKRRLKTSFVWSFFKLNKDNSKTICNLCGYDCPYNSSTSSMTSHLKAQHKIKNESKFEDDEYSDSDSEIDLEDNSNKINACKKALYDQCVLDFIVHTNQSIRIVEQPTFKMMVIFVYSVLLYIKILIILLILAFNHWIKKL